MFCFSTTLRNAQTQALWQTLNLYLRNVLHVTRHVPPDDQYLACWLGNSRSSGLRALGPHEFEFGVVDSECLEQELPAEARVRLLTFGAQPVVLRVRDAAQNYSHPRRQPGQQLGDKLDQSYD